MSGRREMVEAKARLKALVAAEELDTAALTAAIEEARHAGVAPLLLRAATSRLREHNSSTQDGGDCDGYEAGTCRICFGTTSELQLVAPCGCMGDRRLIHPQCLVRWQQQGHLLSLHVRPGASVLYVRDTRISLLRAVRT